MMPSPSGSTGQNGTAAEVPADALSMPIDDIRLLIGSLTLHNVALQAEVNRLKQQIVVLESGVRGN